MAGVSNGIDQGPRLVVGHVTDRTARVWGRGDSQHPVMFLRATGPDGQSVEETVTLSAADGFTGVAELESLSPSTPYQLEVAYGTDSGEKALQRLGALKTFPEPDSQQPCTVLLNSCNFHGWGPFRNNKAADKRRAELARGVDLVIHGGDQVYADKAPFSFTLPDFRRAYLRTWGQPGTQEVLASQANYMVADDHEVVNGYSQDGQLTLMQRFQLWMRGHGSDRNELYQQLGANGIKAFDEFQRAHGPKTEARYYTFAHGRHQFFAMDTRFERHHRAGRLVSEGQMQALFQWLTEHRDQPKFIITSSPFVLEKKNAEEKWCSPEFTAQRHRVIDFLAREKLDKVAFLCGDIHASAHSRMKIEAADGSQLTIHELCASPMNGTLMRSRSQFHGRSQGVTSQGVRYEVELDESSFLGGWAGDVSNSAVMKLQLDGDRVGYELYRTRHGNEGPVRQDCFTL